MPLISNRPDGYLQSRSSSIDDEVFPRDEHNYHLMLDEWRLRFPKMSSSSKKDESMKKSSNKQDQSTTKSISKQDELTKKSSRETGKCDPKDAEGLKKKSTTRIRRHEDEDEIVRQQILDEFRELRKSIDWGMKKQRIGLLEHFDRLYENYGGTDQVPYPQAVFTPDEMESLFFDAISMIAKSRPKNEDTCTYVLFLRFVANSGYKIRPHLDEESGQPIRRRATPVHRAAHCDSYYSQAVRDLFDVYGGFEVNYIDESGLTHLHLACRFGFEDVARGLLELGRGLDYANECAGGIDPPLNWALGHGHDALAELLRHHGARPDRRRPLHAKPNDSGLDFGERYLRSPKRRRIMINAPEGSGNTPPLHLAVANAAGETPLRAFLESCDANRFNAPVDTADKSG